MSALALQCKSYESNGPTVLHCITMWHTLPYHRVAHSRYAIKHICRTKTDELDQHGGGSRGRLIGWVVFLQKMCQSHNSQHLWLWLENRVCRCDQVERRSLGRFLIKFDWGPYKRGNFRQKEKRTPCEDTHLERRWPYKNRSRNGSYAITATECLGLLEIRSGKEHSPTALETAWPYS